MEKLLFICGPTATGKTSLALALSTPLDAELVSADSRQVYRGLDVLTGKDIPDGFTQKPSSTVIWQGKRLPVYENRTRIWLVDFVPPAEGFHLSAFLHLSRLVVADIWKRGKLPMVVGGTGLYMRSIASDWQYMDIPPDKILRTRFAGSPVSTLISELGRTDPKRLEGLNNSDRHNPRRLIRSLEISLWLQKHTESKSPGRLQFHALWIGLTATDRELSARIRERVRQRFDGGVAEVANLDPALLRKSFQLATSLGLVPVTSYLRGEKTREQAEEQWAQRELAYAKRQMTWFQKQDVTWFDAGAKNMRASVQDFVSSWYTKK